MLLSPKCRQVLFTALVWLSITLSFSARSQAQDTTAVKKAIAVANDSYNRLPREKLYLQFDRQSYTVGDTVWLKAYLFTSATFTPSRQSSKIYVELINDSSRVVDRFAVALSTGLGYGQIILNDKVPEGNYTIRAYTNWMQNFGPEGFFTREITVSNPYSKNQWLVSEQHVIKPGADGSTADVLLHLTNMEKLGIAYRDIELRLTDGKRNLTKNNFTTSDVGLLKVSLPLPQKATSGNLSLIITDKTTRNRLAIPFYPGGAMQNLDVQFMPEGGALTIGLASRVGIKAVGEDGLGVNIKGVIVDQKGEQVNTFETTHNGMGVFLIYPQVGQLYSARYQSGGVTHTLPLPVARPSGISFKADAVSSADSVIVSVRSTADVSASGKSYLLIARSADEIYLGVPVNMTPGYFTARLAKSQFASGITCFTLLDNNVPVAERRIFIDHKDRLQLELSAAGAAYAPNDSVALKLNVCDIKGNPVQGSFSVAVLDKGLTSNSFAEDNINSRLLVTSELKGYVEQPGWYLANPDPEKAKAVDLLMLTQGWTGTNAAIPNPQFQPKFAAENGEQLTGGLRTLFNKPIKKAQVKLFSLSKKYGLLVFDTTTNDQGRFKFENLPVLDSIAYTLRAVREKGSDNIPNIDLDEFKPAVVAATGIRHLPWYAAVNDTLLANYLKYPPPVKKLPGVDPKDIKGRLLNEVTIKGKKPRVVDGKFSGSLIKEITEQELLEAKKGTLFDLLFKKVKILNFSSMYRVGPFGKVMLHMNPALVIGLQRIGDVMVDGQVSGVMQGSTEDASPQDMIDFLRSISADEIKDVKVAGDFDYFISVTTRGGHGYFTRGNNNIVRYVPTPYCTPLQYYRPKYVIKNFDHPLPRPTLHWEPNLITGKDGQASLSFFAADKPGTYLVTIEGADMMGNFGRQTSQITVDRK